MEEHNIAVAGPFLVLRIQDKTFLKLPLDERRQALKTLSKLKPKRAEEVCIELLRNAPLFRSSALESTRELAAFFLGEIGGTEGAVAALLQQIEKSKPWSNSKAVRESAAAGARRIAERAQEIANARKQVEAARASSTTTVGGPRRTVTKKKRKTRPPGTKTAAPSGDERKSQVGEAPAAGNSEAPPRSATGE
jgi:hypothetical protein